MYWLPVITKPEKCAGDKVLRVLDSLQLTSKYIVATPADWTKEDDAIVSASISTEDAKLNFSKGIRGIKPI